MHTDETYSNKLCLNYDKFAAKIAIKPTNNPSPPHELQTVLTATCFGMLIATIDLYRRNKKFVIQLHM
jgi:hypothetical protein